MEPDQVNIFTMISKKAVLLFATFLTSASHAVVLRLKLNQNRVDVVKTLNQALRSDQAALNRFTGVLSLSNVPDGITFVLPRKGSPEAIDALRAIVHGLETNADPSRLTSRAVDRSTPSAVDFGDTPVRIVRSDEIGRRSFRTFASDLIGRLQGRSSAIGERLSEGDLVETKRGRERLARQSRDSLPSLRRSALDDRDSAGFPPLGEIHIRCSDESSPPGVQSCGFDYASMSPEARDHAIRVAEVINEARKYRTPISTPLRIADSTGEATVPKPRVEIFDISCEPTMPMSECADQTVRALLAKHLVPPFSSRAVYLNDIRVQPADRLDFKMQLLARLRLSGPEIDGNGQVFVFKSDDPAAFDRDAYGSVCNVPFVETPTT
jgi:hypothetical protein